jgi:anti-sigma factor RsiW
MQPIPYESLVDLAEGRLTPTEAQHLRARIAADPMAQAELAELERLIALMRADHFEDAPDHVINRAIRLMRPAPAAEQGALQRLIAVVMNDSWRTPMAAGFRSASAWPRALLLSAGDRELDLQIRPTGERWQLFGQVLGPEEPGTVVLSVADHQVTTTLNELGEFILPPVLTGRYTLTLRQGQREIIVPNLELGPSSIQN